jgi:hypothetical protein
LAALLGACSVYEAPAGAGAGSGGATGGASAGGNGGAGETGGAGGDTEDAGDDAAAGGSAGTAGTGGSGGDGNASADVSNEAMPDVGADTPRDGSAGPRDASSEPVDVVVAPDGPGCAGYALQFDSVGYVSVIRPVQDDFTLEAWIKTTMSPMGVGYPDGNGIFYADKGMNGNDFGSSVLNGKFAFGVGNSATSTLMTTILSTTNVATGQWVHVAATRRMSTGEIQVFVNGKMEASQMVVTQKNSLNAQPNMTIGGNTVDFHYFVGQIDEVRAWNIVRTGAEITQTMNKTLSGTEPGLVGYWRFDEGMGAVAASSAARNNGSVSGFVTWVLSGAPTCP